MEKIIVKAEVAAPLDKVWQVYTNPEYIMKWNHASDDWYCPRAENDLRVGGNFTFRMEARDGSVGFDFGGTYTDVKEKELIAYEFGERVAEVKFNDLGEKVEVVVSFDPEKENPLEMQKGGWQAILNNFKKVAEGE